MQQSWISYFSNLVKQYGGINLAQGIPGFQPPVELMKSLQKNAIKTHHQYAPGLGNFELRKHINRAYKDKISSDFKYMMTNGATEAIQLLYLYLNQNIENLKTAAFSPSYESYIHLPKIYGNKFKSLSIDSHNLCQDIKNFFTRYQPKLFFVNTPGNPYGRCLNNEEFDCLIATAEQNNCYLIIDAVYNEFYFQETAPYYPFKNFGSNVFYVNSFSKQFSITGWRTGYFFAHQSHFDKISYIHDFTGLCCPSVLQAAIADFLNNKEASAQYIKETKETIKENFLLSKTLLENHGFKIPETHGGYFIWTKLPENIKDGVEFSKDLYAQTKTAIIPGIHFGEEYESWIRINIAREKEELNAGLSNIAKFCKSYQ